MLWREKQVKVTISEQLEEEISRHVDSWVEGTSSPPRRDWAYWRRLKEDLLQRQSACKQVPQLPDWLLRKRAASLTTDMPQADLMT